MDIMHIWTLGYKDRYIKGTVAYKINAALDSLENRRLETYIIRKSNERAAPNLLRKQIWKL